MASLLSRCFCIARRFLHVNFGFGVNLGDRLLPGVVRVDACVVGVWDRVLLLGLSDDSVIGDTDDARDDAQIQQGGRLLLLLLECRLPCSANRHLLCHV